MSISLLLTVIKCVIDIIWLKQLKQEVVNRLQPRNLPPNCLESLVAAERSRLDFINRKVAPILTSRWLLKFVKNDFKMYVCDHCQLTRNEQTIINDMC